MNLKYYILSSVTEVFENQRESTFKIAEQSDKIITWIVGFSIASIVISLSKTKEINDISNSLSSLIIIFSCLTIIFGVVCRVFLYVAQNLENTVVIKFTGFVDALKNEDKIDYKIPKDKIENKSIEELQKSLRDEFGIDSDEYYSNYNNKEKLKEQYEDELKLEYIKSIMIEVKDILVDQLGISDKKARQYTCPDDHKPFFNDKRLMWFFAKSSGYLFIITSLLFVGGFVIFLFKYIQYMMCQ